MRLIVHWGVFLALLLPVLGLGYAGVHHLGFATYLAVLGGVTLAILVVFRQAERLAPTPTANDDKGS